MPGIAPRRGRRDATVGGRKSELWKRAHCLLGLMLLAPVVGSSEEEDVIDIEDFCGRTWADAYKYCPLPCATGMDSDCAALGDGYTCHRFTSCLERIESGAVAVDAVAGAGSPSPVAMPFPDIAGAGNPSPADNPPPSFNPTAQPVAILFPDCQAEYSPGGDNAYGTMVSYPTSVDPMERIPVYSCQGRPDCSAGPPGTDEGWTSVGTCPSPGAATTAEPALAERWWLSGGDTVECKYGSDYPLIYATDPAFAGNMFDSREDCCALHPDACGDAGGAGDSTTTGASSPFPSSVGATMPPATKAPSQAPTPKETSYVPTYETQMPTAFDSGGVFARPGFALGVASVLAAFLL